MQLQFTYDKKKVLQGLRYHFIWQPELRALFIVILAFDAATAILYYIGKIRPQPFLLGSCIWLLFLVAFWYVMPNTVYKREQKTFNDTFLIIFRSDFIRLENQRGYVDWGWGDFVKFAESPNFFHLYFTPKSFFLIPKDDMVDEFKFDLRLLLSDKIKSV